MFKQNSENISMIGALTAFMSGLTVNEIASILGIFFGFFTLFVNWYYKQKEYELKHLELTAKIKEIEKGGSHD